MITSLQGSDHSDPERIYGFDQSIAGIKLSHNVSRFPQGSAMGTGIALLCVCSAPRITKSLQSVSNKLAKLLNRIMLQNSSFNLFWLFVFSTDLNILCPAILQRIEMYRIERPAERNLYQGDMVLAASNARFTCSEVPQKVLLEYPGIVCFLFFLNRVQSR